jgi:hypothetical protein
MTPLRADIWVAAFVRRHNDVGHICVVSRRGDAVAGQIFIRLDHLDGSVSLYAPAPAIRRPEDSADRLFERRFDRAPPEKVGDRLTREAEFDPDFWIIDLEMRSGDPGILVV